MFVVFRVQNIFGARYQSTLNLHMVQDNWTLRSIVCLILGACTFALLSLTWVWNTSNATLYPSESERMEFVKAAWTQERAEEIIKTYLSFRQQGYSHRSIATHVFKVPFPNPHIWHCYPFVCSGLFKAYADLIVELDSIDGKLIGNLTDGAVIYVRSNAMTTFVRQVFSHLKFPFILITHGHDMVMPNDRTKHVLRSRHLIKWFTVSPNSEYWNHSKVACLPYGLGFWNRHYTMDDIEKALEAYREKGNYFPGQGNSTRPIYLYINFNFWDSYHSYRRDYVDVFGAMGTMKNKTTVEEYFEDLANSKFVLSPRGNAIDCFRTYEAILFGAIPVLDDLSPLLTKSVFREAPTVLLEDNWRISRPDLRRHWLQNPSIGRGRAVVLGQYWLDQIETVKKSA